MCVFSELVAVHLPSGFVSIINTFQELDTYLADKVYFLSHRLTLIDLVLFYGLHQTIVSNYLDRSIIHV